MARPQKTNKELEALLKERCIELPIISVNVFESPAYNWDANFVAETHLVIKLQPRFQTILADLRAEYDLKKE